MRHKARTRAEDRELAPSLSHQPQLVCFNRFAQFVVADFQVGQFWFFREIPDALDLTIAPVLQRFRSRRIMAMTVDDHRNFSCTRSRHVVLRDKLSSPASETWLVTMQCPCPRDRPEGLGRAAVACRAYESFQLSLSPRLGPSYAPPPSR